MHQGIPIWHKIGFRYSALRLLVAVALLSPGVVGIAASQEENQAQARQGFDYWQPDWMVRELWGPGQMPKGMVVRLLRHTTYMQFGVPSEYAGAKSTVASGPETVAVGRKLYLEHCAHCHGEDGLGRGEAAQALSPSPALLAYMIRRPISVDEYLLWVISEGGEQFQTKMPAFKDVLSREEIWAIVGYLRSGLSERRGKLE